MTPKKHASARIVRSFLKPRAFVYGCSAVLLLVASARAETVKIDHGYHWQRTNFYCGTATIQMMLDTPAVRNFNPAVDNYFALGGNDKQIQDGIYQASRDRRNMFYPVGVHPGTDPIVMSYTINAYDGIPNGPALPGGVAQGANTNNHSYGWYGFLPNIYAADQASRTLAYAMKNYDVPAGIVVNHGAHWVVVDGVNTVGNIPTPQDPGAQFNILGFRVSDPWTGRALALGLPPSQWGLGVGAWYRYGFNAVHNGFARPGAWYNFFNPVLNNPGHPFNGQFNILVEPPRGGEPTPPFDPDDDEYSSQPDPYDILIDPITGETAYDQALDALAGDFSFLDEEFEGGSWSTDNISLFSFPDDPVGVGDWLVPYVGPGGADDVLGAVMIDSLSGTVNQAMWFDSGLSFTNEHLLAYYSALYSLDIPQTFPEPTTLVLLVLGSVLLRNRRRRDV